MIRWTGALTLGGIAVGLAALAGGAWGQTPGGKPKVLINQSAQSLSAAPVYIAKHANFFADEGLDVEFVATGSGLKSIVPLVRGDSQFCACIFSHAIGAVAANAGEVRAIGAIVNGYSHKIALRQAVAKRLGVTPASPLAARIRALKGLKIGITEVGASTDQVTRLVLEQQALKADSDVQLVPVGAAGNLLPAIANGQIDALTMTPPIPQQAVGAGDAIILVDLATDAIPLLSSSFYMGLTAETGYLAKHGDVAVKVLRAIARAQRMLKEQKAEAKRILREKEFPRMKPEVFEISFEGYYPNYAQTPDIARANVEAAVELARRFSSKKLALDYDRLVDESVARAVKAK